MDRISKSSLATFMKCRRQYYYSLLGYEFKPNEAMVYGTELHKALEKYNSSLIKGDEPNYRGLKLEHINNLDGYKKIIETKLLPEGYKIYSSEMPVGFGSIFGYIDAIFSREINGKTEFLILEYKSVVSKIFSTTNLDKYLFELQVYKYLFSRARSVDESIIRLGVIRFEQYGLGCDIKIFSQTDSYQSVIDDINKMQIFVENSSGSISEFPKVSEDKTASECSWCPFYNMCE
jgi:CRISPR/Cas system-associated exonuclease Cas4 (RecB family)